MSRADALAPRVLVLDVGEAHARLFIPDERAPRRIPSGPSFTPAELVGAVQRLVPDAGYDAVSLGYPGVVIDGRAAFEPPQLGRGWVGFDFARALGCPVRIASAAALQALGSYRGGRMLFLGLDTGLGCALIREGALLPLELAQLPYRKGRSYEEYIGARGLQRLGLQRWRRQIARVVEQLRAALELDDLVLGGGNARHLETLPECARLGESCSALHGGLRLWQPAPLATALASAQLPAVPGSGAAPQQAAPKPHRVVFLFDVDNTLLDNDRVSADLKRYLRREGGAQREARYWAIFEQLRAELGYADYLGALQRYRVEHPRDPQLLALSSFLVNYPFANRLFPGSLDVLEQLAAHGPTVLLSDGDVVFQPRKIERSGLAEAVEGRVLIYIHKERELADVESRFPAERYVLIDDKIRILTAVKQLWGERVLTVFPRQGHYAHAPDVQDYPPADLRVERIAELIEQDWTALLAAASARNGHPIAT